MSKIQETDGQEMMRLFITELKRRLEPANAKEMKSSDFEVVRKLLADNSVTMASVQRGDYGDFAKSVADQFPFNPDEDAPKFTN